MTALLPSAALLKAPRFHLPDELLIGYAHGSLEEAEALLVAVHASLCPLCARKVSEFERVGGALLAAEPEASMSDDLLSRTLAQLDTQAQAPALAPVRDPVFPAPLARLLGPSAKIAWKWALPGVRVFDLPMRLGSVPVRLRSFDPGINIPMHTHSAPEYDLVLTGGVMDNTSAQHMTRGDVAINDERHAHHLTIDTGEECVALSVHNARAKPIGWFARLIFGYTGW
jgi:putative transcriptional regulator